ncbi:MAG: TraB domain-containing protein [Thermoplasmata archaeon]
MIVLIGVGHVFAISERVMQEIFSVKPEVVCVELDPSRAEALLSKNEKKGGDRALPLIYQMLALFQRVIARKFETEPGLEMLAAIQAAKEVNAKLEFIDIDAVTIAERIWREMSFVERTKLVAMLFFGMFMSTKKVEKSIEEFIDSEGEIIEEFGKQFPTLKKILIEDRNNYMAWRIAMAAREYTNIVCVVGEGHIEGLSRKLSARNIPHRIVSLKQLLAETNAEFTWSWVW